MMSIDTLERIGSIFLISLYLLLPIWLVVRIDGWKGVLWGGGVVWLIGLLIFGSACFGDDPSASKGVMIWAYCGWILTFGYAVLIFGVKTGVMKLIRLRRATQANTRTWIAWEIGVGLLIVVLVLLLRHYPIRHAFSVWLLVIGCGCFVLVLIAIFRARQARGRVEVDCGPHPLRWLLIALAGLYLPIAIKSLSSRPPSIDRWDFGYPLPLILFCLYLVGSRLQICANGIWQYVFLTRWEQITACHWQGDALLIETRKGRRQTLRLTPACRKVVAAAVQEHCPAQDREKA